MNNRGDRRGFADKAKDVFARPYQDLGRSRGPATAVTIQGESETSRAWEHGSRQEVQPPSPDKHYRSATVARLSHTTKRLHHCTAAAFNSLTQLLQRGLGSETKGGGQRGPGGRDVDSPLVRGVRFPQFAAPTELWRRAAKLYLLQCTGMQE
ncbi:hypothetical protein NDU88_002738 [Pleurodeles waltl]|uniref:Uncharacterized protein n=1 Tax=Pleurodeles waltl TaxID=8319 RepID=A0AAV7L241_PLEWA|nr:hypothetical protein NDU88_002738 [Pleurodeles waltl]